MEHPQLYVTVAFALTALAPGSAMDFSARVVLTPDMIINESGLGDPTELIDEQDEPDPLLGSPSRPWAGSWNEADYPLHATIDLGRERRLGTLWLHDLNGEGRFTVSFGEPGLWREVITEECLDYDLWKEYVVRDTTRYIRFTKHSPSANVGEVVLFERLPLQPDLTERRLIDEVIAGSEDPGREWAEYPARVSRVEDLLGRPCRVVPGVVEEAKYWACKMGQGKGLVAGRAYALEVDFPEDAPRAMFVRNGGCEAVRGFHTGATVGDALHGKYVSSNPESLNIPLSGEFRTFTMRFFLHDRFPGLRWPRDPEERPLTPGDGFWVTIAHLSKRNSPLSAGAAWSAIRLYEIPPEEFEAPFVRPPEGLPQRHVFVREEMSDGVVASTKGAERGVLNPTDWFEYGVRIRRSLGMDTYAKDLLEFGANQGWDSAPYGGNEWCYQTPRPMLWRSILTMVGEYGMPVLPYYEYCGTKGARGYGNEKRCMTLGGGPTYTHISWCEMANADITDPDTLEDLRKILDCTVMRHTDIADFLGAWLRPRPSHLPISFSDACLQRYAQDTGTAQTPTRGQMAADERLYADYLAWWFGKRREFLEAVRDMLREGTGREDAVVLLTTDPSEGGMGYPSWENPSVVAEDPAAWEALGETPISLADQVAQRRHFDALTRPQLTWDWYEWQHSVPPADPEGYAGAEGVMLSYTINRAYTVLDPGAMRSFTTPSGLAVVHHAFLNENEMDVGEESPLGYFVSDMEYAGPYCMLAEALAVANGDPWWIGHLSSSTYNSGFPEHARAFNAAFLSLPALPSVLLEGVASDDRVVVSAIDTHEHGTWLAVVNTGYADADVTITLPRVGRVTDAVTGADVEVREGRIDLSLYPCELRALRIR